MFLTFIASFHAVLQERKLSEKFLEDDGHRREEERRSQRELEFSRRERHVLQVELMMKQWIAGQDVGLLSECLEARGLATRTEPQSLWSEVSTSCVVCPCACSCLRTGSWFGSYVASLRSTVDHVVTLWPELHALECGTHWQFEHRFGLLSYTHVSAECFSSRTEAKMMNLMDSRGDCAVRGITS